MTLTPLRRAVRALAAPALLAVALLVVLSARATPAFADHTQLSIMMDDDELLYQGNQVRDDALRRMASLGVDAVRATVLWSVVAHDARHGRHRRKHFKAQDPSTYPHRNWDRYDELVRNAAQYGIKVYFDITGPGPGWSHRHTRNKRIKTTYMPRVGRFHKFVKAVGKRFDGHYKDENGCHCTIPAVRMWSIWNEPNQAGWLSPQTRKVHGKRIPYTPIMYRRLWFTGRKALDRTGHKDDAVFIGETAPIGNNHHGPVDPMDPKTFIREFFCLNRHYKPYHGRNARLRDCKQLYKHAPIRAYAWAHHPYEKTNSPYNTFPEYYGSISMGNLDRLTRLLDLAQERGLLQPPPDWQTEPVILSEFGYETNPPDPFAGIDLAHQATYLNLADFMAYLNPRVIGTTQFLLKDAPPLKQFKKNSKGYWHTYQSGLFFADGKPKPAASAYALPFFAYPVAPNTYHLWGQLRFLPNTPQPGASVDVQWEPRGSSTFSTIASVPVTDRLGYFQTTVSADPGTLRLVAVAPSGAPVESREIQEP